MSNLSDSIDFNCREQISQDRMVGCMVRIILEIADDQTTLFFSQGWGYTTESGPHLSDKLLELEVRDRSFSGHIVFEMTAFVRLGLYRTQFAREP